MEGILPPSAVWVIIIGIIVCYRFLIYLFGFYFMCLSVLLACMYIMCMDDACL